jgi:hypothetical protein
MCQNYWAPVEYFHMIKRQAIFLMLCISMLRLSPFTLMVICFVIAIVSVNPIQKSFQDLPNLRRGAGEQWIFLVLRVLAAGYAFDFPSQKLFSPLPPVGKTPSFACLQRHSLENLGVFLYNTAKEECLG